MTTTGTCTNCGAAFGADDMFCEACGFEPVTGSVPNETDEQPRPPSLVAEAENGKLPSIAIEVAIDRDYFDAAVTEGEIEFPDPVPAAQMIDVPGSELHIGRTSESRAVHPDVDVADLTGDPAVSTRHAVLRQSDDGTYSIIDVGSTNGTFLADVSSSAIAPGEQMAIEAKVPIFVGAWTRLTIVEPTA